jgi:hypothetical protein
MTQLPNLYHENFGRSQLNREKNFFNQMQPPINKAVIVSVLRLDNCPVTLYCYRSLIRVFRSTWRTAQSCDYRKIKKNIFYKYFIF